MTAPAILDVLGWCSGLAGLLCLVLLFTEARLGKPQRVFLLGLAGWLVMGTWALAIAGAVLT